MRANIQICSYFLSHHSPATVLVSYSTSPSTIDHSIWKMNWNMFHYIFCICPIIHINFDYIRVYLLNVFQFEMHRTGTASTWTEPSTPPRTEQSRDSQSLSPKIDFSAGLDKFPSAAWLSAAEKTSWLAKSKVTGMIGVLDVRREALPVRMACDDDHTLRRDQIGR